MWELWNIIKQNRICMGMTEFLNIKANMNQSLKRNIASHLYNKFCKWCCYHAQQ